jgi:hypothetical protein
MKTFEERHAEWLDGRLNEAENSLFERELAESHGLNPLTERAALDRLKLALREHMALTRMPNPDFFNHRLLERIEADRQQNQAPAPAAENVSRWIHTHLLRLALFGAAALALGVVAYRGLIAPELTVRPETAYLTQVLDAKSPAPDISAVSFNESEQPAAVLWLDGVEHVPESYATIDEANDPDAVP